MIRPTRPSRHHSPLRLLGTLAVMACIPAASCGHTTVNGLAERSNSTADHTSADGLIGPDEQFDLPGSDVRLLNRSLADRLRFHTPIRSRVGSIFQVEAPVENPTVEVVEFEYRFEFLDVWDAPLAPALDWQAGMVLPGDEVVLRAFTRHENARHYRLEIRARPPRPTSQSK